MNMKKCLVWCIIALLVLSVSSTVFTSIMGSETEIHQDTTIAETDIGLELKNNSLEYPFEEEYPSVEDLYDWYGDLEDEFPELIEKHDYGESYEDRELYAWEITSDEDTVVEEKPSVLIDGALHAREWSTVPVASYFTWRLLDEYETNETINWLVNNRRIFVVPMVNPDGYIYDGDGVLEEREYWRKNRNDSTPTDAVGVDLNRNWDIHWEEGDDDPSSEIYHGEAPFSEPETYHLKEFMLEKEIDSYQNLHSHWGTLLIPSTNMTEPTPHDDWYRGTADHMTSFTTMLGEDEQYSYGQPHEEIGYGAPGAAADWVYDEIGAQSYLFEIYTGEWEEDFAEGFYPPEEDIMTINEDLDDSLIYQTRVADTDLGDGEELEYPPVPYLVYGTVEDEDDEPLAGIEVEVENRETGESVSVETNGKGYYELNLADLIDHGYDIGDTLRIQIDPGTTMMNFDVDESWGQRTDLEYTEDPQVTTEDVSVLTNESAEFEGKVGLGDLDSVEGYFQYRVEDEEGWQESEREVIEENRTYDMVIDGLESDEFYEVRAAIEWNEERADFGRIMTFETKFYDLILESSVGGEVIEPGEGEFEYLSGSEVTFEASPDVGYDFVEWIGDVETIEDTESSQTTVEITDNYEITALFQTGEGTEEDPYLIENVHHLQNVEDDLEAHYELATDIDASETKDWNDGRGFDPVGDLHNRFEGTFDGGGHKINELNINQENREYTGLFGVIGENSEVENLDLLNVNVTGSYTRSHWVGGLAGASLGLINNTYLSGDVNSGDVAGGVIGQGPGTVKNSYSTGNVTAGRFVGGLQGTSSGDIFTSASSAKVEGTGSVGGLLGGSWGVIQNSYATGEVIGGSNTGGLVGQVGITLPVYSDSGEVINCYSVGEVSGDDEQTVGGLVGDLKYGEVTDSFWNVETSGQNESDGGIGLTTEEMVRGETFTEAGWDFEEDWDIIEEETYPFLQWQEEDTYPYAPDYSYFEVDIIGYEEEVEEGETVTVEFTVENTGEIEDTQEIVFSVDGAEEDSIEVTLEGGKDYSDSFTWEAEDEGDYGLEVASDDTFDSVTVTVEEEEPEIPGFTTILLILGAVIAVAIYHKKEH